MVLKSPALWSPLSWFALAGIILVADLVTKEWANTTLQLYQPVEVLPFFNLTLVYNPGAAFGILADSPGWQRWFFVTLTVVIGAVIAWWLAHGARAKPWLSAALALVLGGALGNLVDRVRFGYVVDFLDVHALGWHWPAFNLADAAITTGAVLLVVITLLGRD